MKYLIILFALCTSVYSCKPKPTPTPVTLPSDILKYTLSIPTNKAVDLITKQFYDPMASALSDFTYINLGISAPYKSLKAENNCYISTLILSDAIFNAIKSKAMLQEAANNGSPSTSQPYIDINEPLAPYNILHQYFYITTNSGKTLVMRIDGYQAGVAHDLQVSIILVK